MVQAPFSFKNAVRKILRGRMLGMNGHSAHACAVIWGIYDFTQLIVLNDLLPVNSIYNFIKCVNIMTLPPARFLRVMECYDRYGKNDLYAYL